MMPEIRQTPCTGFWSVKMCMDNIVALEDRESRVSVFSPKTGKWRALIRPSQEARDYYDALRFLTYFGVE